MLSSQSGSGPASLLAVHSALAKLRRVLPAAPARRIDAVIDTVGFTAARDEDGESSNGPDDRVDDGSAQVLLVLAEAARDRRPVTFGYTVRQGSAAQRSVQPHGVVAHRGRLYLTGFDVARQALRTFRLDRIDGVRLLEGTFAIPAGSDPVQQVIGPLSQVPWRHDVSFRIQADIAYVRTRIPETLASVTPMSAGAGTPDGWLRVFLRAERLEWVAGTLAMLDRPFVIESPSALHETVAALGHRLTAAAGERTGKKDPAAPQNAT
jgi:predicted DNA-binding transcriptional regulator YafY